MSDFLIKTGEASTEVTMEQVLISRLTESEGRVDKIRKNLSFKVKSKADIEARLRTINQQINKHKNAMSNIKNALDEVIKNYEKTESAIVNNAKGEFAINKAGATLAPGESSSAGLGYEAADWLKKIIATSGTATLFPTIFEYSEDLIDIVNTTIDKIEDTIIDATNYEAAIAGGVLYSNEIDSEYGSTSVSIGGYDYYANSNGGLFVKDDDGNLIFSPYITAEAGASICLFAAASNYAMGDENLGATANGEITVGEATAKVSADAGLFDSKGNLNPSLSANGSLEAVLVEAKGEAGVTVLGTEAKVNASAYVGLGAHADMGYSDGILEFDMGAALGIGASIGFEIDVGGTVDALADGCESVLDFLKW